ncbi:MAG: thiamine pyrophosphate-binding protein [Acidimicrobiales bacterium]
MAPTGGDAVVAGLRALRVRHVFGIASVHNLPIVDAIRRDGGIEWVATRHEQGAVHAADGYARATGELGVAVVSTGPGTANAMGGLYEAAYASSPVLLITGQVESAYDRRALGHLHEADRQADMLRAVCREVRSVRHREAIAETIVAVAVDVLTGRHQPGAVEIPIDLQHAAGSTPDVEVHVPSAAVPADAAVRAAVDLLNAAERPLLVAGGGVVAAAATEVLTTVAEKLGAPVVTSIEGRGAIAEDHPLAVGPNTDMGAADVLFAEADVVLAVGTRFQQATNVQRALRFAGELIHLDVDGSVIGRVHRPRVRLVGDARAGLQAVLAGLAPSGSSSGRGDWSSLGAEVRRAIDAESREAMGDDLQIIMDAIAEHLPRGGIVVKDATISSFLWANRVLPVLEPRTSMRTASMAIGPGLPLGIGAALGTGKPTVVIHGDGGIMLTIAELATAGELGVPLVVCVFNDGGYGILRYMQDVAFAGRRTGVDLATPDFVALAGAFGVRAERVTRASAFPGLFREAVGSAGPWLLDIDLTAMTPMRIVPQTPSTR